MPGMQLTRGQREILPGSGSKVVPKRLPALSPLTVTSLACKPGQEPHYSREDHQADCSSPSSPQISPWLQVTGVPWGKAPLGPLLPALPTHHSLLGLDEGPAEAVHFGVEPASVAQVVAGAVPPPQRGLDGAAVDALPALGQVVQQLWGQEQRERRWGTAAEPGAAQRSAAPAPPTPGPRASE